ncbi:Autophagy-related protein 22 [Psilocybe cubensis]|uniref:Autophagy-related protein 22 n=2 Tax=Psilocybe cubensis TaxID=181762 RepID=A0ACB8GJJ2_PSICU|nr:Autophagy-related protein 22 [Psilocybe cubensis]KAH9475205.1 Autophagy-related protein 22 [Psilocybe cubensis]
MAANVGFGASTVAMNAYIPSLAREAPEVVRVREEVRREAARAAAEGAGGAEDDGEDADPDLSLSVDSNPRAPLLSPSPSSPSTPSSTTPLQKHYTSLLSRTTSRISSHGIAIGYAAGIALLLVALVPVTLMSGSAGGKTLALRVAVGMSGIWWGVGTVVAGGLLGGGEVVQRVQVRGVGVENGEEEEVGDGDGDGDGDEHLRSNTSNLKAEEEDKKNWSIPREIAASWIRLADMLRWSEMKKLRNTFRFLAAWFLLSDGSVYGAFQGYARALYAELLPPGEEARWYGLFSITDKRIKMFAYALILFSFAYRIAFLPLFLSSSLPLFLSSSLPLFLSSSHTTHPPNPPPKTPKTVLLIHRPPPRRPHRRHDRQHPLCVSLFGRDGAFGDAGACGGGC